MKSMTRKRLLPYAGSASCKSRSSARVSRAGNGVLAIADFPVREDSSGRSHFERSSQRDAATSTRDARATHEISPADPVAASAFSQKLSELCEALFTFAIHALVASPIARRLRFPTAAFRLSMADWVKTCRATLPNFRATGGRDQRCALPAVWP